VKKKIVFFVIVLHVIPLAWALFFSPSLRKKSSKKHLVVKTIAPLPSKAAVAISSGFAPKKTVAAPSAKKSENKKPPAAQKKKTPSPVSKKTPEKKTSSSKKDPKVPKELLQELEKSLSKLDEHPVKATSKPSPSLPSPKAFSPLAGYQKENTQWTPSSFFEEGNYEESLVQMLHQMLNLPEYGEVKIQITLKQDGTVAHLKVISAESEKNKTYLEKHLPHLRFSHFTGPLSEKKEHTFTLTFCNEL